MNIHSPLCTHNFELAQEFLSKLDPKAKQHLFAFFDDHKPKTLPPIQFFDVLNGGARIAKHNSSTNHYGAFVTVNETDGRGRAAANIIRARALWADCDEPGSLEQALATCQGNNIEPSWVTRSVDGKGHIYFFMDGMTLEDFKRYEGALVTVLGGDPGAKDISRVLRLPGSLHTKGAPQLVTGQGNGQRYTLSEVVNAFELDAALLQTVKSRVSQTYTHRLEENEVSPLLEFALSPVFRDGEVHVDELNESRIEDLLARIYQVGLSLAHDHIKPLATREGWRDRWLFPLAAFASEEPDQERAVKEIFDSINEKCGGSTTNNEIEWKNALQSTVERLSRGEKVRSLGSLFAEGGNYTLFSPEAVKAQATDISHSWKMNATISKIERYDDIGNGRRLTRFYGDSIRYIGDANFWMVWDDSRWLPDKSNIINQLAICVVDEMHRRADHLLGAMKDKLLEFSKKGGKAPELTGEQEKGRALSGWAKKSSSKNLLQAMTWAAQHLCIAHQLDFDRDAMLLGVQNGAVDLRTGAYRQATSGDYITKLAGAPYTSNMQCPNWLIFLDTIMDGDQELINYLQRAIGYSLTGSVSEEVMFVMFGKGANGKTTFIETISDLFGDYATACDASLLMRQHLAGGGASPDIAKLKGARLITVNETEDGAVLNEDRMKYLVSKSKIAARNLYSDPILFDPTHKIWLATNHKPTIKSSDLGTWRRIHLIPFKVTLSKKDRIADFKEIYLMTELSGILNWALAGALAYQESGLNPPKIITDATEAYREDLDFMNRWIEDNCHAAGPEIVKSARGRTKLSYLHRNFRKWAAEQKAPDLSASRFIQELELRNYPMFKSADTNQRMVRGLTIRIHPEDELGAGISTP